MVAIQRLKFWLFVIANFLFMPYISVCKILNSTLIISDVLDIYFMNNLVLVDVSALCVGGLEEFQDT